MEADMSTQMELAKSRLFGEGSLQVANIKLFPGSDRDSTPEQMAEQVKKSLAQIEAGDYELVDSFED
jgi:hypothetical protein